MDMENETTVDTKRFRELGIINTKLRSLYTNVPLTVDRAEYLGSEEINRIIVDDLILDCVSIQNYGATVKIFTTIQGGGRVLDDVDTMNKELRSLFVDDSVTRVELVDHEQKTIFSDWNVAKFQFVFSANDVRVSYRVVGEDVLNPQMFDDSFFGEEHKKLRDLKRSV